MCKTPSYWWVQPVPSYFPIADCRWQSIESLKGIPYSGCLLIRLKAKEEPREDLKGDSGWRQMVWDLTWMEVNTGSDRKWEMEKARGEEGRCWEKVETERREDGREEVLSLATLTPNFDKAESCLIIIWMSKLLCACKHTDLLQDYKTKACKRRKKEGEGKRWTSGRNFPLRLTGVGDYIKIFLNYSFVECVGGMMLACFILWSQLVFLHQFHHKSDDPLWFTACKVFDRDDGMMKALQSL